MRSLRNQFRTPAEDFSPGSFRCERCYNLKGFTLVELLTVIGIFLVISVLLVAGFRKIMSVSASTRCANQLRQIYGGIALYMQDNNQEFPPANPPITHFRGIWTGYWYHPSSNPQASPAGYFGEDASTLQRLSVCPLNRDSASGASVKNKFGYPYVCNYEVMRQKGSEAPIVKVLSLKTPSKTFLLADSGIGDDWGLGVLSTSIGTSAWNRIREAHQGNVNILWADGHVSATKMSDIKKENVGL